MYIHFFYKMTVYCRSVACIIPHINHLPGSMKILRFSFPTWSHIHLNILQKGSGKKQCESSIFYISFFGKCFYRNKQYSNTSSVESTTACFIPYLMYVHKSRNAFAPLSECMIDFHFYGVKFPHVPKNKPFKHLQKL